MTDVSPPAKDIVVIGASAGGVTGLQQLVAELPAAFPAAVLVVLHLPEGASSVLPEILTRDGALPAHHAVHGQHIQPGRVYIARPGFHLTIERSRMRVVRGARENGHRPAIDPLFRSAALAFGSRVVGVILSGLLDDGAVGLREVKKAGGAAAVQDPNETPWPSMPRSALQQVDADFVGSPADIGRYLVELTSRAPLVEAEGPQDSDRDALAREELKELTMQEDEHDHPGIPSPYSCPECHGVLWELRGGDMPRFRCRVGHAYSSDFAHGGAVLGGRVGAVGRPARARRTGRPEPPARRPGGTPPPARDGGELPAARTRAREAGRTGAGSGGEGAGEREPVASRIFAGRTCVPSRV